MKKKKSRSQKIDKIQKTIETIGKYINMIIIVIFSGASAIKISVVRMCAETLVSAHDFKNIYIIILVLAIAFVYFLTEEYKITIDHLGG
jgi:hypothetical protein